jgi:pimeloyl-ACP methyl ester carboxylesterase
LKTQIILTFLATLAFSSHAGATECSNFFGQRCLVDLPTGVHMSYYEIGPKSGEPLILLHTDTTTAVEWAWTAHELARLDPGIRIFALDQRGAGSTDLPNTPLCRTKPNLCITQAQYADDLLAFMDTMGIARATIFGHAWGSRAARVVALNHPTRVTRLIMSGIQASDATRSSTPTFGLNALDGLGWRKMLEARGVRWPEGALHLRPIDFDADAVRNITQNWDISAIAAPEFVAIIAAQTAAESLASWGVLDPTPHPRQPAANFENLTVPTLVLWGSSDNYLDRASQDRLMDLLRQASKANNGMYFYWKQYGVHPAPASRNKHQAIDIGHNLSWDAPRQLAADIASFMRSGAPTRDRYRTNAPANIREILVEPGQATIVTSR